MPQKGLFFTVFGHIWAILGCFGADFSCFLQFVFKCFKLHLFSLFCLFLHFGGSGAAIRLFLFKNR